jgi:hypothetical protein
MTENHNTIKEIMDMTVDNTRIVAEWKETKYLVLSSSLFMAPAIYGFYNNLYFLSLVLVFTSGISINHWRDAKYSWRRIADRIFSKITFAIFFYYLFKHSACNLYFFLQNIGLFKVVYCYYMSNKHHNTPIWWKYHMKFHVWCVFSEWMILKRVLYDDSNDSNDSNVL